MSYKKTDSLTGEEYISREDICEAIGLPSLDFLDELLIRCNLGRNMDKIGFQDFVDFLETGTLPKRDKARKEMKGARKGKRTMFNSVSEPDLSGAAVGVVEEATSPASYCNDGYSVGGRGARGAPSPSRQRFSTTRSGPNSPNNTPPRTERATSSSGFRLPPVNVVTDSEASPPQSPRILALESECMYPSTYEALGFRLPVKCRALGPFNSNLLRKRAGNGRPLWKKQETVIQERIVKYTTVEPDGTTQELVESEKNQTEVTHMECKDTGEFAHTETTEYEQMETFNEEIVMAERGNEHYVHLKSLDDEYEHMESNMPRKEREAARQQAEHEAMMAAMEEEKMMRMQMEAEMEAERLKMAEESGEALGDTPVRGTPVGMRLGEPMPDGLTHEEQMWWHNQQRAMLEEHYMAQMAATAGQRDEQGNGQQDAPIFYNDGVQGFDGGQSCVPPHEPVPPNFTPSMGEEKINEDEEILKEAERYNQYLRRQVQEGEAALDVNYNDAHGEIFQQDEEENEDVDADVDVGVGEGDGDGEDDDEDDEDAEEGEQLLTETPAKQRKFPEHKENIFLEDKADSREAGGETPVAETPVAQRMFQDIERRLDHDANAAAPKLKDAANCGIGPSTTANLFASPTLSDKAAGLD